MEEDGFLVEIRRLTRDGTAWWVTDDGLIRTIGTFGDGGPGAGGGGRCPIIELHRDLHRGNLTNKEAAIAMWALGLSAQLGTQIVNAADNNPGHDAKTRERLLRACGLQ